MNTTPVSLLERLGDPGNRTAWDLFVRLYAPLLDRMARRLPLQDADRADLVQDVFALLVRNLPTFRYDPRRRFRAWLWRVLLNKSRERARQAAAAPEAGPEPAAPDVAEGIAEADYRRYLTRRALELMRAEFQPGTWRAFWECVVHERPAAAVADELGRTENAVYLAKARASAGSAANSGGSSTEPAPIPMPGKDRPAGQVPRPRRIDQVPSTRRPPAPSGMTPARGQ